MGLCCDQERHDVLTAFMTFQQMNPSLISSASSIELATYKVVVGFDRR
jgi:hypothetical protein